MKNIDPFDPKNHPNLLSYAKAMMAMQSTCARLAGRTESFAEIMQTTRSVVVSRQPGILAAHQYLERRAHKARARVFLTMLTIHGFCAILAGGFAACGVWPMALGCLCVVMAVQWELRKEAR